MPMTCHGHDVLFRFFFSSPLGNGAETSMEDNLSLGRGRSEGKDEDAVQVLFICEERRQR